GGSAAAPTARPSRLLAQLDARRPLPAAGGRRGRSPGAPAARAVPNRVGRYGRGRVSAAARRADRAPPRQRLRDRATRGAVRTRGRRDSPLLRLPDGRLGPQLARGGDLVRAQGALMAELDVVTGAFSYTGRHIAEELLARGRRVRTLTRREPDPSDPLAGKVETAPLAFDDSLRESLPGVDTLYNTYWVRF